MLQAAMGWTGSHLHSFRVGDAVYGMQFDDDEDDELDEKDVSALQVAEVGHRFGYQYDFGDSWDHEVVVESVTTTRLGLRFAVCVDGQNACPPEECGGTC